MTSGHPARERSPIHIRPAEPGDRTFLLDLARRAVAFGVPPWRDRAFLEEEERRVIAAAVDDLPAGAALLVAHDDDRHALGFIYLMTGFDPLSGHEHGHVYDLAVTAEAEGSGVGRALVEAGERWARERGYSFMTLNVFPGNARGRAFYERIGYGEDMIKLRKPL